MRISLSEEPNFRRPELLLHPQVPKELAGVNPRSILGQEWWDAVRKRAYRGNNNCCWACGTPQLDAPEGRLDAHECYELDYASRTMTFTEVVALCQHCHAFIHCGYLWTKLRKLHTTKGEVASALGHGLAVLRATGLRLPWTQVLQAGSLGCGIVSVEEVLVAQRKSFESLLIKGAGTWKLVFQGKEYTRLDLMPKAGTEEPNPTEPRYYFDERVIYD